MTPDIATAIGITLGLFKDKSHKISRDSWQGKNVKGRPDFVTFELMGHRLISDLGNNVTLSYYQQAIKPDLPWADDHFAERVSGTPLNPPPSEAWWPHAPTGNAAFKTGHIFSHTYPERFWPKYAGAPRYRGDVEENRVPNRGIRYDYGDLKDVVGLLAREPFTRQAYLPIFFPEDTGNVMRERTPCSLGYLFMRNGNRLNIWYYIRSCDVLRHFRNDVYFTVRLLLWVIENLGGAEAWKDVTPGIFIMDIASLHCFRNDWQTLFGVQR